MPNTPNILMEQTGATAGEYEYDYGSYGDLLEKQLAAIKAQAELKEKERAETSPLGTRNMAILNLALTGRGVVEGAREKYIMGQMTDMGKEATYITDEKYKEMPKIDQADYQKSADGRWFKGDWEYEKGPESKLRRIGNALIGWQQGIQKVATGGQGMDAVISGKAAETVEKTVVAKIDEVAEMPEDITGDDPSRAPGVFDENLDSGTEAGIPVDLPVDQSDGAHSSAMADIPEEELGDIKPDKAWDNVNVGAGVAGLGGSKKTAIADPVNTAVAAIAEKKRLSEGEKTMMEKSKQEKIDTGELNIYGREMDKNPSADKFMDWNEQAELRRKGTGGGSMTPAEWNELRDGSSEEVPYDDAAVTDEKPKMTTDLWGSMGKKEQADWRSKMKSELGILKSSNKMEKRSGLLRGLDALKKLKNSIVNRIIPPTAAAFKTDNNSLYKQMRGVGINPLNK